MKREIKFRAWHQEQKRMFQVYGIGPDFITEQTLNGIDYGTNAFCDDDLEFINVMQFTGLRDKNGKEIYEGDIVRFPDRVGAVEWISAEWGYRNVMWPEGCEVIGNIHQTPELLKP